MPPATLLAPTQLLPDTPPPKKVLTMTEQPTQISVPTVAHHELELMFSIPHHTTSPALLAAAAADPKASVAIPQDKDAEEEYTLSAYGDLSLCEDAHPPEHVKGAHSPLLPKSPPSRLRLRVRRPPMPKRRLSYVHIAGPMPLSRAGLNRDDERWPGIPSPRTNTSSWYQHQPIVFPLLVESPPAQKRDSGSSLEKLVKGLMPRSPSIRLSPPGSPANHAVVLPLEDKHAPVIRPLNPTPAPVPQENKQKSGGGAWRTRLPPRPPIPKWDV